MSTLHLVLRLRHRILQWGHADLREDLDRKDYHPRCHRQTSTLHLVLRLRHRTLQWGHADLREDLDRPRLSPSIPPKNVDPPSCLPSLSSYASMGACIFVKTLTGKTITLEAI